MAGVVEVMPRDEFSDIAIRIEKVEGVGIPIGKIVHLLLRVFWRNRQRCPCRQPILRLHKLIFRNVEGKMVNGGQRRVRLLKPKLGMTGLKGDLLPTISDHWQAQQVMIKSALRSNILTLKRQFHNTHDPNSSPRRLPPA